MGRIDVRHNRTKIPYFIILAVFAASRLLYYALGVRFDARGVGVFFQFIDPELLKSRMLESLFYLHMQPPGYNLLLGLMLKLFPESYGSAFHVLHLFFGASIGCLVYYIMRSLGVSVRIAVPLVCIFIVSPGVVMFENFVLYEYLLVFILSASAALLFRFFELRSAGYAVSFLICQFSLVFLRNQFHLFYFIAIFACISYFTTVHRIRVIVVGAVLLIAATGLYLKNYLLFGQFVSSTWMGMNMTTIVQHQMSDEEMTRFIAAGLISPVSRYPAGTPLDLYMGLVKWPAPTGIPVLDQVKKSTGGDNFNNSVVLDVGKIYMKDGLTILRHDPKVYLRSVVKAWFAYFLPTGDFPNFDLNRPRIYAIDRAFNLVVFGQFRDASDRKQLRAMEGKGQQLFLIAYTGVFLIIGLPVLFIFGMYWLVKGVRLKTLSQAEIAVMAYILFNIGYLTLVANTLSCFENNRYRFQIDMFFLVLLGLLLQALVAHYRGRLARVKFPGLGPGSKELLIMKGS